MSRDDLISSTIARLKVYLDLLDRQGSPGSIVVELHHDGTEVRKVVLGLKESWSIKTT